jgi:ABC-type transporter Mla subunit MlaD
MARATKKTAARRPTTAARRPAPAKSAPAAASTGVADLAGGLRSLLDSVEGEVRAVSSLSERIDDLVTRLNKARDEQARRLTALDTLKGAAQDGGLSSFLDKLIRPRMPRVQETVPKRLR